VARGAVRPAGDDAIGELARAIQILTGRTADSEQKRRFSRYLDLILLWNRAQRLTGPRSCAAIVRDLFQDSLLFLTRIPEGPLVMRISAPGWNTGSPTPDRAVRHFLDVD
jgi:hypothetical protein